MRGVRVPFIVSWAHPNPNNKFQKAYPIAGMPYKPKWERLWIYIQPYFSVARCKPAPNHILDGADFKKTVKGKER